MSHNKLYRNFIILQEDERGYSSESEKALSGYAKVEAKGDKCKISFYAQNLRKEDNYSMMLICCKRDFKELIDLGPLAINEVGKGDTSREYYINNIAGLGISYEKVSGAAICKTSGNEINFIMHGFMNGDEPTENWRKFKLVKVELKKEDSVLEAKKSNDKVISSKVEDINLSERNENIKVESVEKNDSNIEAIEEKISEEILSEEERNKCKKDKKCEKEECKKVEFKKEEHKKTDKDECKKIDKDECKKIDKGECKKEQYKKCDKDEAKKDECKKDSFEEMIDKLCDKIDDCNHYIDLNIHDIDCEYIVYGFIKKKYDKKYEWKKFKVKKEKEDFGYKGNINKRIDENTRLDLDLEPTDFDKYEKDIRGLNDSNMNGNVNQYFEKIVRGFDVYDDKLNDIDNCKWYRVNVDSIDDLCNESNYNKYTLAYYPMINYYPYISKNNHFLLGYKCDTGGELQYIVYGIPGSKDKEEQPYGGKTGFVTWTSNNKRSQGYWLMFYDFKNSSIVVPMKK
ncbi:MAG: hypothetical protein E7208_08585 [Clostridium butyricum]|nr:hypothetical protein [Clostridium butyricum]